MILISPKYATPLKYYIDLTQSLICLAQPLKFPENVGL